MGSRYALETVHARPTPGEPVFAQTQVRGQ